MFTIADVVSAMDSRYPPATAETWDSVGLTVGHPGQRVRKVHLAVDAVAATVHEAIEAGADLLITHHPLYLRGTTSVAATSPKGRLVHRLIENRCGLMTAHTNADKAGGGVNDALATTLGISQIAALAPEPAAPIDTLITFVPTEDSQRVLDALAAAGAGRQGDYERAAYTSEGEGTFTPRDGANPTIGAVDQVETVAETRIEIVVPAGRREAAISALRQSHPYEEPAFTVVTHAETPAANNAGLGRVGVLPRPTTLREFAQRVAAALPKTPAGITVGGDLDDTVERVVVSSGSGDSYLAAARAAGADVMVTADLRHHPASEHLEGGKPYLVGATHWASEWPWLPHAANVVRQAGAERGADVEVSISTIVTDPWVARVGAGDA